MSEERLSFRWGIPELDHGNVIIPEPIYRYHGQLGVKGNAFVLIMHLAAFRFETEHGESSPSYQTLADRMGIERRSVIRVARQLEEDGWLRTVRREHQTSIFNFGAFSQACWDLYREAASDATVTPPQQPSDSTVTPPSDATVTPLVTHASPEEQEEKNKKTKNNTPPSSPPRVTMAREDLTRLTEHFAELQGVRPRGKAWLPIQQGMRAMVVEEDYAVDEVLGCMDAIAGWGVSWTIATVRRWIAHYAAGAMPEGNGQRKSDLITEGHDPEIYERRVKGPKRPGTSRGKAYYLEERQD